MIYRMKIAEIVERLESTIDAAKLLGYEIIEWETMSSKDLWFAQGDDLAIGIGYQNRVKRFWLSINGDLHYKDTIEELEKHLIDLL